MVPNPPPRMPQAGYLYVSPYRVQGISIAGEETVIQVPELDICFDIGRCPRIATASRWVALSHGHMDHAAGLAYYFSQRFFQGMDVGQVICHTSLAKPIHNVMRAWVDLEAQRTPYVVKPMEPDEEIQIKHNIDLRAFQTVHTVPSLGYIAIEKRSKLKPEYAGLEQEQLVSLKKQGKEITQTFQLPLVCFTGDTAMGPHFDRQDVLESKILIVECTFIEPGHRSRAGVGKHLHLDDILEIIERSQAEHIILTHMSRRTHIVAAREQIQQALPARHRDRVHVLMDGRTNRLRFEKQQQDAQQLEVGHDK